MIRAVSILLALVAAASAITFTTLDLGGYSWALEHERIALAPLIAGLGAAILEGCQRHRISRNAAAVAFLLIVLWTVFLGIPL